jgi:hypothetical protein
MVPLFRLLSREAHPHVMAERCLLHRLCGMPTQIACCCSRRWTWAHRLLLFFIPRKLNTLCTRMRTMLSSTTLPRRHSRRQRWVLSRGRSTTGPIAPSPPSSKPSYLPPTSRSRSQPMRRPGWCCGATRSWRRASSSLLVGRLWARWRIKAAAVNPGSRPSPLCAWVPPPCCGLWSRHRRSCGQQCSWSGSAPLAQSLPPSFTTPCCRDSQHQSGWDDGRAGPGAWDMQVGWCA